MKSNGYLKFLKLDENMLRRSSAESYCIHLLTLKQQPEWFIGMEMAMVSCLAFFRTVLFVLFVIIKFQNVNSLLLLNHYMNQS